MGIVGKLLGRLARGKSNAETPPFSTRGWETLAGYADWQKAGGVWEDYSKSQLLDIGAKHSLVYSCIQAIASRVPEAPLEVGQETEAGWQPEPDHYLNGLLARPNKLMSGGDVLQFLMANLLSAGEAYLWELRDEAKVIEELWPIPSSVCEPHWTNNTAQPIDYFTVQQGKGEKALRIPSVNMTMLRFIDPRNYQQSLGPLQAASREYQTDEGRQDYVIEMLKNLNVPGLAVFTEAPLPEKQKSALKAKLSDVVGPGKRGSTIHIGGKGGRLEAIAPLKDLDWPGLNAIDETRICATFKTPPVVVGARVGVEKSAQFANYSTALWHFYTGTMRPTWTFLAQALTRGLVVNEPMEEKKGVVLRFNLDGVQGLQEDGDKKADRSVKLFQVGLATMGQAVEMAGLPAMEESDPLYASRYMPMNLLRVDKAEPDPEELEHLPKEEEAQ